MSRKSASTLAAWRHGPIQGKIQDLAAHPRITHPCRLLTASGPMPLDFFASASVATRNNGAPACPAKDVLCLPAGRRGLDAVTDVPDSKIKRADASVRHGR